MPKDQAYAEENPDPTEHSGDAVHGWHNRVWRPDPGHKGKDKGHSSLGTNVRSCGDLHPRMATAAEKRIRTEGSKETKV
jgi:hypothetical protein